MEHCRLQVGCLMIVGYIAFMYFRECKKYKRKKKGPLFCRLFVVSMISILLDGITAITVNSLDTVNLTLNKFLHMLFLISLDMVIYIMFRYMLIFTGTKHIKKNRRNLLHVPFIINVLLVVLNINSLEFRKGVSTNYSMGWSAYACFGMMGVYFLLTFILFLRRWNYIESAKRISMLTYLLGGGGIAVLQAIFPEILMTSIVVSIMVVGIYMNQEDPIIDEISRYQGEMVMGFATLVENKDGSTGGHIRRTTAYVHLLAEELRRRGYYKAILTKDYIYNLCQAAPMHDIGKIAVPDVVLQKPGRLTEEEFSIIKKHTTDGGKIIKETFGNLGNKAFAEMTYQVAKYHHEKWNGKGYPEGLSANDIPLCARIMAIADVFDAVSEHRCYRPAMPLEKCFSIIEEGSGKDFDPIIAKVFLEIRDKVEVIHNEVNVINTEE